MTASRRVLAAATTAAVGAGGVLSTQSYVNGRLARAIDSAAAAALQSTLFGLLILLSVAAARGRLVSSVDRLRRSPDAKKWSFMAGILGGLMIAISTYAAPIVGIAVLTVAIVCGQTFGGLVVDAIGLSPMGKRRPTVRRVLGVVIAVAAVTLSAGSPGGQHPVLLLATLALAGAGFAVQQAAVGHLRRVAQDPFVAGSVVFAVSAILTLIMTLASLPIHFDALLRAPWYDFVGAPLGVVVVVTISSIVRLVGVLRLSLAMVAGQTLAGLSIDLLVPASKSSVDAATVLGAALTIVAAGIAGSSGRAVTPSSAGRRHDQGSKPATCGPFT